MAPPDNSLRIDVGVGISAEGEGASEVAIMACRFSRSLLGEPKESLGGIMSEPPGVNPE